VSNKDKGTAGTGAGPTRTPVGQASVLAEDAAPSRAGTYMAVIAVEAVVIAALWAFSRYFSV
jgi:hypothetical protein